MIRIRLDLNLCSNLFLIRLCLGDSHDHHLDHFKTTERITQLNAVCAFSPTVGMLTDQNNICDPITVRPLTVHRML